MARINVYNYASNDDYTQEGPTLAGWFNSDSAETFTEDSDWDGSNHISVNTGSQWDHETLYRTKGGRWVLGWWSQYESQQSRYEFISDDRAKNWLLHNNEDDAAEKWFGDLEEEAGPSLGGRPQVGPKVEVRLDEDTLRRVAAYANGRTRADALRDLVAAGLDACEPA